MGPRNGELPKNVKIFEEELDGHYVDVIKSYLDYFDIIIIDGGRRNDCMKNCLESLKEKGIIIVDNSDRKKYDGGFDWLKSKGFKRLDFWGLGPIAVSKWCTSLFYRDNNFLEI